MSLEQLPEFTLFLDRGASVHLLMSALRELGVNFVRHDDIFPQATPDTEWLAHAGRAGWLVLTLDQNISYNNLEKAALLSSGVGSFVLVAKKLNGQRIANCIIKALPAMQAFAKHTTRPFIAKIYADSRVLAQPLA
ncbi:hypothetical protein [Hymenobacter psoromatis]|uniref:PIN-like domain-containing protein n=1 Tax=Hymenobacter psoromatis TaxID=1484116 RepID=UPI001CC17C9B|nr:hypothetical protein [Hymenobacter psoromatis]